MRITPEDIQITAAMAHLFLSSEEQDQLADELSRILDYAAQLQEIDVQGVPPTTHAVPLSCPLRPDQVGHHLDTDAVLRGAPATEGAFFSVPAILNHGTDEG